MCGGTLVVVGALLNLLPSSHSSASKPSSDLISDVANVAIPLTLVASFVSLAFWLRRSPVA